MKKLLESIGMSNNHISNLEMNYNKYLHIYLKTKCTKCNSIMLYPIDINQLIYNHNKNNYSSYKNIIFNCNNCNNLFRIDKNNLNKIIHQLEKEGIFKF